MPPPLPPPLSRYSDDDDYDERFLQATDHAESGVRVQPRRRPSERRFGGWETRGWPQRRKRIEEIRAGPSAAAHGGRAEIVGTKRSHRGAAHGGGGTEAAQVRAPRDGLFGPFAFVAPIASYGGWAVPLFLLAHLSRCDVLLSVPARSLEFTRFRVLVSACTSWRRVRVITRAFLFPCGG